MLAKKKALPCLSAKGQTPHVFSLPTLACLGNCARRRVGPLRHGLLLLHLQAKFVYVLKVVLIELLRAKRETWRKIHSCNDACSDFQDLGRY
ncbi:hypothetical protein MPTK1_4g06460 [Marchantia polymorpha subsp. ruderalis]|uniref:Uncharacterized protein n=2 Tax=Marchantia polymorpha TaxID=3197 RepID=A0AAF6B707_MARPO|nr:hypothetical protein MARPO_0114s0004 [Marchantia polymorpha]BBN07791.1 hypothetical protein Mp_4g06460 [Marchantia polymorpha subsp. ruderalis]|eukprot:PTQ31173.1 hypothetical protein MARPO_0114s0004 [Marchantia polymorpha]